jgi:hypothetical protein
VFKRVSSVAGELQRGRTVLHRVQLDSSQRPALPSQSVLLLSSRRCKSVSEERECPFEV